MRTLDVVQDAADRGAVQSVQVKGPSTSWQDLDNVWGASWETGQVPEGPLDLHIYDDLGVDVRCRSLPAPQAMRMQPCAGLTCMKQIEIKQSTDNIETTPIKFVDSST